MEKFMEKFMDIHDNLCLNQSAKHYNFIFMFILVRLINCSLSNTINCVFPIRNITDPFF